MISDDYRDHFQLFLAFFLFKNMKSILRKAHAIYFGLFFCILFVTLFPLTVLFLSFEKTKFLGHIINKIHSHVTFFFVPVIYKKEYRFRPSRKENYVFCANHSSFLDVPLIFVTISGFFNIIGKASIGDWPLFGYMYKRLYITVDRKSRKSGRDSFNYARESIENNRSMVLFPEGTIPDDNKPNMIRFKDGAFRLAIEKQIPIVPITMPFNWIIMPDYGQHGYRLKRAKIIVHEAIDTKGMTEDDVESLKEKTRNIIANEIKIQNT